MDIHTRTWVLRLLVIEDSPSWVDPFGGVEQRYWASSLGTKIVHCTTLCTLDCDVVHV